MLQYSSNFNIWLRYLAANQNVCQNFLKKIGDVFFEANCIDFIHIFCLLQKTKIDRFEQNNTSKLSPRIISRFMFEINLTNSAIYLLRERTHDAQAHSTFSLMLCITKWDERRMWRICVGLSVCLLAEWFERFRRAHKRFRIVQETCMASVSAWLIIKINTIAIIMVNFELHSILKTVWIDFMVVIITIGQYNDAVIICRHTTDPTNSAHDNTIEYYQNSS